MSVPEGLMVMRFPPPKSIADKEAMASLAGLACIAHPVTACVMVMESWVVLAKPGRPLDPTIPSFDYPDRRECVCLICECPGQNLTKMLPIIRTSRGGFLRFGRSKTTPGIAEGRLSRFMPTKVPSLRSRSLALKKLTGDLVDS
jgi:hypothetical protein